MDPRSTHRHCLVGAMVPLIAILALRQPLAQCAAAQRTATPELRTDGTIVCGAKSVRVTRGGQISVTLGNEKAIKIDQQMSVGTRGWTYPPAFGSKELKIHREERRVEFTGRIRFTKGDDGPTGDYRLSMELMGNGLVRLHTTYSLPEGEHKVRYDHVLLQLPFGLVAGGTMRLDHLQRTHGNTCLLFSPAEPLSAPMRRLRERNFAGQKPALSAHYIGLKINLEPYKYHLAESVAQPRNVNNPHLQ